MLTGIDFNAKADLSELITAINKLLNAFERLVETQGKIQGQLLSTVVTLNKEGEALTTIKTRLSETQVATTKLDEAQNILETSVKDTTAAYERQQAALAATRAEQAKAATEATRIVRSVTFGVGNQANYAQRGATPLEIQEYESAKKALKDITQQHSIAAVRGKQMWIELKSGAASYATTSEKVVGDAMARILRAEQHLGAERKRIRQSFQTQLDREYAKEVAAAQRAAEEKIRAELRVAAKKEQLAARLWSQSQRSYSRELAAEQALASKRQALREAVIVAGLRDIDKTRAAQENLNKSSQGFLMSWQSFGRLLTIQLMHQAISQLSQVIRQGTADAMEFQIRISEIRTISQSAALSAGDWAKGIRDISDSFGFEILDVAESTYQAISNQIVKGAESFGFMNEAAKLAVTTVSTLTQAEDSLASVINSYGMKASDATEISAKLFTAVNLGRFRLEDAASTLGNITVISKEVGVSFDELMAGMVAMTIQGFTWSQSMTQMRGLLSQLIKPSTDMAKFFESIGVSSGEAAIKTYGLIGVVDLLKSKTDGTSTAIAEEVKNIRGLLAALSLSGQGHKAYTEALDKIRNSTIEYTKATEIAMESNARKIQIETAKVKNYFINDIGNTVLETMVSVSKNLGGFSNIVKDAMTATQIALSVGLAIITAKLLTFTANFEAIALRIKLASTGMRIALGLGGVATGVLVTTELLTRFFERQAELEEESFKLFTKNINDRKTAQKSLNDATFAGINDLIQKAYSGIAIHVAEKVAELNKTITDTITQSKSVAKIIDEAIGSVIQNLKASLGDVKKSITDTEQILNNTNKALTNLDNTFVQLKRDMAENDISDQPQKLLDKKQQELREIQKLLQSATTQEQVETLIKRTASNIKEQSDIQEKNRNENIKNATERKNIEEQIRKADVAYGAKSTDQQDKLTALLKKRRSEERDTKLANLKGDILRDKEEHDIKIKNFKKELEEHKNVELKVRDLQKQSENARLAFEKKLAEIHVIANVTKLDQGAEERVLSDKIKDLQTQLKELDRLSFEKIIELTDSTKMKSWMNQRVDILKSLIAELNAQIQNLPDLEQINTQRIIDQYKAELGAIDLKQKELPQLQTKASDVEKQKNAAKLEVEQLKKQLESLGQSIGILEGHIITGVTKLQQPKEITDAEAIHKYAVALSKYGENVFDILDQVKLRPELLTKQPIEIQEMVARLGDFNVDQLKELDKNVFEQAALNDQLAIIKNRVKKLSDEFAGVTDTVKPLGKATEDMRQSFISVNSAIGTFDTSLRVLADKLQKVKITFTVPEVTPTKEALGGYTFGSDSVPALLSPGEFVMNAKSSRRFYSQLVAMNSVGRFSEGGSVSNTNVGDINISMKSSGNESIDAIKLGRILQREIRRGTISLS